MYSKLYEQETGVPQGSILSVTLFCLKINSVVKEHPQVLLVRYMLTIS